MATEPDIKVPSKPHGENNMVIWLITLVTIVILLGAIVFVVAYFMKKKEADKEIDQQRKLHQVDWKQ